MNIKRTNGVICMHSLERRGAHNSEHVPGRMANWDLVRIFLEVARVGSFRAAAERLNMSANYLSKRISMLEQAYKTTLMTRHVDGIRLTREGLQVLEAAKRMEEASFGLDCALNQATPALSGEVRIAVTEGLGTFWLAPRLVEFQRAFPSILVDLHCAMRSADVSRHEADIAIQLSRPQIPDVKAVKLGRMHLMFFASEQYLATHGTPRTVDELIKHRLVIQLADEAAAREALAGLFPGRNERDLIVMKT